MMDRKARLAALAAKAGRSKEPDDEAASSSNTPKVNFRNYVPQDASLVPHKEDDEPDEQPPVTKKPKLEEALEQAEQEVSSATQTTTTLVETKKINWDLKRDLEPQLDKLERRTQKAMVELLKERLAKEATEEELD